MDAKLDNPDTSVADYQSDANDSSQIKDDNQSEATEDEELAHGAVYNIKKAHAEDSDDTLTDDETPGVKNSVAKQQRLGAPAAKGVDLELDESVEELNCQWEGCQGVFDKSSQLSTHIEKDHIANDAPDCKWQHCDFKTTEPLALATHIRKHAKYQPYFCLSADCNENFSTANELIQHLTESHNKEHSEKVSWFAYLQEFDNYQKFLKDNKFDNSEASVARYNSIKSNKQFMNLFDKPKVDFIKIQNVSVDDIVSEPIRKKGRTANSDINVQLRSSYKEKTDKYKAYISRVSQTAFDDLENSASETLEPDSIIDKSSPEELKGIYESMNRKLLWGLEVNQILKKDAEDLKTEERRLWIQKEALLDASISAEVPKDDLFLYNGV
jgi:hypothetical protein